MSSRRGDRFRQAHREAARRVGGLRVRLVIRFTQADLRALAGHTGDLSLRGLRRWVRDEAVASQLADLRVEAEFWNKVRPPK